MGLDPTLALPWKRTFRDGRSRRFHAWYNSRPIRQCLVDATAIALHVHRLDLLSAFEAWAAGRFPTILRPVSHKHWNATHVAVWHRFLLEVVKVRLLIMVQKSPDVTGPRVIPREWSWLVDATDGADRHEDEYYGTLACPAWGNLNPVSHQADAQLVLKLANRHFQPWRESHRGPYAGMCRSGRCWAQTHPHGVRVWRVAWTLAPAIVRALSPKHAANHTLAVAPTLLQRTCPNIHLHLAVSEHLALWPSVGICAPWPAPVTWT
jgi:hypothetical protein